MESYIPQYLTKRPSFFLSKLPHSNIVVIASEIDEVTLDLGSERGNGINDFFHSVSHLRPIRAVFEVVDVGLLGKPVLIKALLYGSDVILAEHP